MMRNAVHTFLAGSCAALISGCTPSLPYSTQTPPLILAPTQYAGVADDRARFREIYCTIYEARRASPAGSCEDTLHRLEGEGEPTGRPVQLGPSESKLRIRIVPGIFGECAEDMATPFLDAVKPLQALGYEVQGHCQTKCTSRKLRQIWLIGTVAKWRNSGIRRTEIPSAKRSNHA